MLKIIKFRKWLRPDFGPCASTRRSPCLVPVTRKPEPLPLYLLSTPQRNSLSTDEQAVVVWWIVSKHEYLQALLRWPCSDDHVLLWLTCSSLAPTTKLRRLNQFIITRCTIAFSAWPKDFISFFGVFVLFAWINICQIPHLNQTSLITPVSWLNPVTTYLQYPRHIKLPSQHMAHDIRPCKPPLPIISPHPKPHIHTQKLHFPDRNLQMQKSTLLLILASLYPDTCRYLVIINCVFISSLFSPLTCMCRAFRDWCHLSSM